MFEAPVLPLKSSDQSQLDRAVQHIQHYLDKAVSRFQRAPMNQQTMAHIQYEIENMVVPDFSLLEMRSERDPHSHGHIVAISFQSLRSGEKFLCNLRIS